MLLKMSISDNCLRCLLSFSSFLRSSDKKSHEAMKLAESG